MTFSERMGIVKVRDVIQTGSLDEATRNALWNVISPFFKVSQNRTGGSVYKDIWTMFCHKTSDTVPRSRNIYADDDTCYYEFFREIVISGSWNECLDLVEFIATSPCRENWEQLFYGYSYEMERRVMPSCGVFNAVFEQYLVGYRFVNGEIVPITNKIEISSVETAIRNSKPSVAEQLNKSLKFFSDRKTPDYAKSVDCSISAVEAQCRILLNDPVPTLGKSLKKLEDQGVALHGSLKSAFDKLYGFTSDADGIRHAGLKPSDVDQDLAKFMLISCSAFVNYLRSKQVK